MGNTVTVRLTPELAEWLAETSRTTGVPASRIIREQLARARAEQDKRPFLKLLGKLSGPPDLSSRKGYSRR